MLRRPALLWRYTQELVGDELPSYRSDYLIDSPESRDWLLAHSRRIARIRSGRWTS